MELLDKLNPVKSNNYASLLVRQLQRQRPSNSSALTTTTTTTTTVKPIIAESDAYSSKYQFIYDLWKKCILENQTDVDPHNLQVTGNSYYVNGQKWCPRFFDGFTCWKDTAPNALLEQPCPGFVTGFDPRLTVVKRCDEDGSWITDDPKSTKLWTNYTSCVDVEDLKFRIDVNDIYITGYSISLAALILSLMIFIFLRSLQCTRIRIHMHLFSAMAVNNILWIVWYKVVLINVDVLQGNTNWCQILHIVVNYFMVTSYFWTFCEGLHLHIALVVVFVKEKVAMRWFIAIGWGFSLIIVIIYAFVRYIYGNIDRCWIEVSDTLWIIGAPVLILLLVSFVFLVNVIRVLYSKLLPGPPHQNAALATRKAARATLLLVPLFGLHFLLMPFPPAPGSNFEKVYQIVCALITSFQGTCVSILFCFTNHDVTTAAKMYWSRAFYSNDGIPMGITGAESTNTRENLV